MTLSSKCSFYTAEISLKCLASIILLFIIILLLTHLCVLVIVIVDATLSHRLISGVSPHDLEVLMSPSSRSERIK